MKPFKQEGRQARCKSSNKSGIKNRLNFMKDIYEEAEEMLDETNNSDLSRVQGHNSLQDTSKKQKGKATPGKINKINNVINISNNVEQLFDISEVF